MPACPHCDREIAWDAKFCPHCGKRDPADTAIYSGGGSSDCGLGTVLFGIPLGWTVGGFVLWIVLALAINFIVFMTNGGPTSVANTGGGWAACFRWSSYIAIPVSVGGAVYSWYRVLSDRDTWTRIGTQSVWIIAIIFVIFFLSIIGKFLGGQMR